jgi:hypothetical protein
MCDDPKDRFALANGIPINPRPLASQIMSKNTKNEYGQPVNARPVSIPETRGQPVNRRPVAPPQKPVSPTKTKR